MCLHEVHLMLYTGLFCILEDTGGQKYKENTKKQNLLEEIKQTDSSKLCTLKSKRYILFIGRLCVCVCVCVCVHV